MRAKRIQIKSSKMQIRHTRKTAVLHVSATKMSQDFGFERCKAYHLSKGWSDIGYHFYIEKDGTVFFGRPLERNGAHVRGFNSDTLGICCEGGLNEKGIPEDTMNELQKLSVEGLLLALKKGNSKMEVKGHRDYSPDLNNNGVIEPFEFSKACPCYDAKERFKIFNSKLEDILAILGR
jgi:N-acetylmuramoyl-L-alanine amidase